jgi:hypothetical protein
MGYFQSSHSVTSEFFSNSSRARRDTILTTQDTLFLYAVVCQTLLNSSGPVDLGSNVTAGRNLADEDMPGEEMDEDRFFDGEGITFVKETNPAKRVAHRAHCVSIARIIQFPRKS